MNYDNIQLALQGERNDEFINEELKKLEDDSSDEENQPVNNFSLEKECLLSKMFHQNSLCFLIKSRGYGDDLSNPLKAAVAIELQVTKSIIDFLLY